MTMTSNSCFLLFLCLCSFFSYSLQDNTTDACTNVDCGKGKCVVDEVVGIGILFHCKCNEGWSTIEVGPLSFGPCVVPNYFSCGGKYPPTPPFTPINFTSRHYCQCHEQAANLFDDLENICIQQCYLDGDCGHLGLLPPPSPPTSGLAPGGGKSNASYSSTKLPPVLVVIFMVIFLSRT